MRMPSSGEAARLVVPVVYSPGVRAYHVHHAFFEQGGKGAAFGAETWVIRCAESSQYPTHRHLRGDIPINDQCAATAGWRPVVVHVLAERLRPAELVVHVRVGQAAAVGT